METETASSPSSVRWKLKKRRRKKKKEQQERGAGIVRWEFRPAGFR